MHNVGRIVMTLLILHAMIRFTEELKWKTKPRAITCCQGNKQLLMWNFTTGDDERVTELHWFFNENTLVCLESQITGFRVSDRYEDRVERSGTAEILLKNVSVNDEGEYTLYVKLDEEKERNVQGVLLTVVEPPPNQCKPIIDKKHTKGIISCSTSCERSPLSLEWIFNGTQDPVGIGPYFVVNSSRTSEQPFCCLRDFKCHDDDRFKFCTPNQISFTEDIQTVNQSFKDADHTVFISTFIAMMLVLGIVCTVCTIVYLRRRYMSCHKRHYTENQDAIHETELKALEIPDATEPENSNTAGQCSEDLQQVHVEAANTVAVEPKISNTDGKCNENPDQVHLVTVTTVASETTNLNPKEQCNDVQTVAVEPKNSNTAAQCNEDLQQVYTVDATTDRPLQDSNQHVQIVNNFSIDTDFLKSIIHSNTVLTAELRASREEIRKLKWKLHRNKDLRKKHRYKYSYERTKVKCDDTDTSESSDFEDASSEMLVHPNHYEPIASY